MQARRTTTDLARYEANTVLDIEAKSGHASVATFTPTKAGTFEFHSDEGDDEKLGMTGNFVVIAAGTPATGCLVVQGRLGRGIGQQTRRVGLRAAPGSRPAETARHPSGATRLKNAAARRLMPMPCRQTNRTTRSSLDDDGSPGPDAHDLVTGLGPDSAWSPESCTANHRHILCATLVLSCAFCC
jgi:hypothetical protein